MGNKVARIVKHCQIAVGLKFFKRVAEKLSWVLKCCDLFQIDTIVQQRDMYKSIAKNVGGVADLPKTPTGPRVTSTPGWLSYLPSKRKLKFG